MYLIRVKPVSLIIYLYKFNCFSFYFSKCIPQNNCIYFQTGFADDESGEKAVSVLLNGEESELIFIDHATNEISVSLPFPYFLFLIDRLRFDS